MYSYQVTTNADTPTLLVEAESKTRNIVIHNSSGTGIYIGDSNVTSSNGFLIDGGEKQAIILLGNENIWGISGAGTDAVYILTPDAD
jgi:hypothetical protein